VAECKAGQTEIIKKRLAFVARMVKNAVNTIGSPNVSANTRGGENQIFFKTIIRSELTRVMERFKELNSALNESIGIECEKDCDKGEIAYNRALGSVVHICPVYFNLSEDDQVNWLLVYVADRKVGGNIKDQPGSAEFAKQDKDAAYKNLWTYVAYARAVSDKNPNWKFLGSEFRYEREIQDSFDDLRDALVPEITDEQLIRADIKSYVSKLRTDMTTELGKKKIESSSDAERAKKNYTGKLNDLMKIAGMVSDEYKKYSSEAFTKWMLADKALQPGIDRIIDKIAKKVKEELMQELNKQFKLIQAGTKLDFNSISTVMKNVSKSYIDKLKLLDGYTPFLLEVEAIDKSVEKYMEKLKSKLPASKQSKFETNYLNNLSVLVDFDKMALQDAVADDIINGKPFDPKTKPGDPDAVIKHHKSELDKEFKKI
jgi:hypothetical protein